MNVKMYKILNKKKLKKKQQGRSLETQQQNKWCNEKEEQKLNLSLETQLKEEQKHNKRRDKN